MYKFGGVKMVAWGMGAKWCNEKLTDDFLINNCISIGWSKDDAPNLYAMFADIKINDIIYIKAFVPKNRQLNIYAVGVVKKTLDKNEEITVEWFADMSLHPLKISLNDFKGKNNVYSNTLYREYNEEIISFIFDEIKKLNERRNVK